MGFRVLGLYECEYLLLLLPTPISAYHDCIATLFVQPDVRAPPNCRLPANPKRCMGCFPSVLHSSLAVLQHLWKSTRVVLIPIGTWQGGELWCQDDSGDTCYPGMVHKGFVKPIVPPYITFKAAASTWYLALVLGVWGSGSRV